MRILMVASEALPFAKTGGLADILGALPVALARFGHDVDVVLPRYRGITAGEPAGTVTVRLGGQVADAQILPRDQVEVVEGRALDLRATDLDRIEDREGVDRPGATDVHLDTQERRLGDIRRELSRDRDSNSAGIGRRAR